MTKPGRLKLDLQLFAEGDPVDPVPPADPVNPTDPVDPQNPQDPVPPQEPFLKVKYNKEELALDREKAVEYAQKGMNYDKVIEKLNALESDPRLSFVEQQAKKYSMTVPQYLDAVREEEEREKLAELTQKNIPEDLAKEVLEGRKFREQYHVKEQSDQAKAQQEAEFQAFLDTFPEVQPSDIPQSVWDEVTKGKSLVDAYTRHENQALKQKLAEIEKGKEIDATNAANAAASTGSVQNNGNNNQLPFFTEEQVSKMSRADVNKNWNAIMESQKRWYQ